MSGVYKTQNPDETKELGKRFALKILNQKEKRILSLVGDLGGGKTTFLQGFAVGLGIKSRVLSPTFLIIKKFKIRHAYFNFFYHIDCYRVQTNEEILSLGFGKVISNPQNIIAVEWGDRIDKVLPPETTLINFEVFNKNKRVIKIKCPRKKTS